MCERAGCVRTLQGYPGPDKGSRLAASSPIRSTLFGSSSASQRSINIPQSPAQGAARTPVWCGLALVTDQFVTQINEVVGYFGEVHV